jgi:hypothetical protein
MSYHSAGPTLRARLYVCLLSLTLFPANAQKAEARSLSRLGASGFVFQCLGLRIELACCRLLKPARNPGPYAHEYFDNPVDE